MIEEVRQEQQQIIEDQITAAAREMVKETRQEIQEKLQEVTTIDAVSYHSLDQAAVEDVVAVEQPVDAADAAVLEQQTQEGQEGEVSEQVVVVEPLRIIIPEVCLALIETNYTPTKKEETINNRNKVAPTKKEDNRKWWEFWK